MMLRARNVLILAVNIALTILQILQLQNVQIPVEFDSFPYPNPVLVLDDKYCEVLIMNHQHNFHYEVLESIMALYPLPKVRSCNQSRMGFTFAISDGHGNASWTQLSTSWYEYAMQNLKRNEYTEIPGQSRYLNEVFRNSSEIDTHGFDYQIRATCYCDNHTDTQWLMESELHYCVFHSSCSQGNNSTRAMWLNPHIEPSFFPVFLPQFNHNRTTQNKSMETHHLCVIGDINRREYCLIAHYLRYRSDPAGLHFHHFGRGNVPAPMDKYTKYFTIHDIPNFTQYQFELSRTCDAILSLITRSGHPEYFEGPTRLSGAIVQASAYRLPIVLHRALALGYSKHLEHIETHGDTGISFAIAIERLLSRLTKLKASNATS